MKNSERSGSQLHKNFNPSQGLRINPARLLTKLPGFLILLFGFLLILNACGSEEPAPTPTPNEPDPTGTILVKITTTGRDDDPEGYTLNVEGSAPREVAANSEISIPNQRVGRFTIELSNIANHCTSSGNMVREVNVTADGTATVEFEVDCKAILRERIAYGKGDTNVQNIKFYSSKLDGSDEKLILDKVLLGSNPLISLDGTKIAFQDRLEGTNLTQIFVMDADGENLEMIPFEASDSPAQSMQFNPIWHPDSKKITFSNAFNIVTYDLEKNERNSFRPDGLFQVYDVFDNGNQFLAVVSTPGVVNMRLAVISNDGSRINFLTDPVGTVILQAKLLKDDKLIYIQRSTAPGSMNEVWTVNLDGSDNENITQKLGFDGDEQLNWFTISPNRDEFLFWINRGPSFYISKAKINVAPQRINFQSSGLRNRPDWSQVTRR